MVFKPAAHLVRKLGSKATTIHGSVQSLVAGTQSTYTNTPLGSFGHHRYGKSSTFQLHNAFQNNVQAKSISTNNLTAAEAIKDNKDGGLAEYYAAWQRHVVDDPTEWRQYQFPKRIEWQSSPSAEEKGKERESTNLRTEALLTRVGLGIERVLSAGVVEHGTLYKSDSAEAVALAKVDEAIAQEIKDIKQASQNAKDAAAEEQPETVQSTSSAGLAAEAVSRSPTGPAEETSHLESSRAEERTAISSDASLSGSPSPIGALLAAQRYAEIPAVFESMLRNGEVPAVESYNAMLTAAIALPAGRHQKVPRALDVYSDMLRRDVVPDTTTYSLLLELLSTRAIEVHAVKELLNADLRRFGASGAPGRFIFRTSEVEHEILAEDEAFTMALRLFAMSVATSKTRTFSSEVYRALITASAHLGEVDHMIRVYSHLESSKALPYASIYPAMIKAFAKSGDLRSALECYDEYKSLAIADDKGHPVLKSRADEAVYAAVVLAYRTCGDMPAADRFLEKLEKSFSEPETSARLSAMRDVIFLDGIVQERLGGQNFVGAIEAIEKYGPSESARYDSLNRITAAAADHGEVETATKASNALLAGQRSSENLIPLLAMHVRNGDLEAARELWTMITALSVMTTIFVQPTTVFAMAMIGSGAIAHGITEARQSFAKIRASSDPQSKSTDLIDEGIEAISVYMTERGIIPGVEASMSLMWAMVENGGMLFPVAEGLLAGVGPEQISELKWQDLKLALQVQSEISVSERGSLDSGHVARFAALLDQALSSRMPLDAASRDLVQKTLDKVGHQMPVLLARWKSFLNPGMSTTPAPYLHRPVSLVPTNNYDPYAHLCDQRGSAIIVEELEKKGPNATANLNEALARFRNIRRAGRHPRYIAYAKLISAAAKDGRFTLVHDLFGMANQDMPLLPEYPVVRHGWTSILDAMVGACLSVGNRTEAARYHDQLLEIGSAPSANTYGLYITTLKESTKTFDEASEAVKIFLRAKREGVEPTSFLYNALIGKLGKARRIDDCLFYFAEMRALNIRPTSVTYGTIVNALCRVSDERFAEDLFDEMESMPNYKPRPAPYNSMMQFLLTTKRDSSKVLQYYNRMQARGIEPTMHTYKLLIDTHATLEPVNLAAAEAIFDQIRATGRQPEAVHYASLIHANGCVLHDMEGARKVFDNVLANGNVRPQSCLYQALFESMVANHCVKDTQPLLKDMESKGVTMTPYIANTLIHGWAIEKNIAAAQAIYENIGKERREPSTYEAMTRGYLSVEDRDKANGVVQEMLSRGYPSAVSGKVLELLGNVSSRASSMVSSVFSTPSPVSSS